VKPIFANQIVSKLETAIPTAINSAIGALLSKLPTEINVGPITVLLGLSSSPMTSNSYLVFPMITMLKYNDNIEPNSNKGLEILMNDYIYNNVISLFCKEGIMHLSFSSKLFGHNFTFECGLPTITYVDKGISTSIDGTISFKIIGITLSLKIKANLAITPQIVNQNIGLLINTISVTDVKLMGFEAKWFANLLNLVFVKVKTLLNSFLDRFEIPIPSIPSTTLMFH